MSLMAKLAFLEWLHLRNEYGRVAIFLHIPVGELLMHLYAKKNRVAFLQHPDLKGNVTETDTLSLFIIFHVAAA